MRTQEDRQVRLVALDNLEAMCAHVSGTCHRYWIEKVTRSRVWVGYSNPNEYGTEHPFFVVFPAYPSDWCDDDARRNDTGKSNPRVVLDCLRIVDAGDEYDPIQSFHILLDCPHLWRDPETGKWTGKGDFNAH